MDSFQQGGFPMNKLLIATAAVALATAGTAGAADLPMKAPPMIPPPAMTWTGCWISGGVGYGMWNQDVMPQNATGTNLNTMEVTVGGRGWLGRAGVGCDYQVAPQFVIGAFADYDWSNIHGRFAEPFFFGTAGDEKLSSSWSVGGRVGYLPYPNLLTFVSGGWTQAHFDAFTMSSLIAPSPPVFAIDAHNYQGWFIGGGTEYRLPWWQNLTWKTEYRYSSFRADNLPLLVATTRLPTGVFEHNEKFVQTVTTSLVWRFNWGGPVVARY
jgi:outer membrane immunogenic protein